MTDKRRQLIETAFDLFYHHGTHAVGINEILKQANVAKKTLYSHFDSKASLLEAVLHYRDERFVDWLQQRINREQAGKPALLAVFDALDDWFNDRVPSLTAFNGCFFINTCSEYADVWSGPHQLCHEHKKRVRALIETQLARLDQVRDPVWLVDMLSMLKEGAIVTAQVQGDRQAALKARRLAEQLLTEPGLSQK
mgnify:CR=1 FL=1